MEKTGVKVNFRLSKEFNLINSRVDNIIEKYARKVYEYAQEQLPVDEGVLRASTQHKRVSVNDYVVFSDADYAVLQHERPLLHLGKPGQSISQLYRGVGTKIRREIENAKKKSKSMIEELTKTKRSPDYDYTFGLRALKGWKPKGTGTVASILRKHAVKKGTLIRYKADWFNTSDIEKNVGILSDIIERSLKLD